ncbi:unnamed protein product, partial [Discosporangium mesarthrocarpum]
MDGDRESRRLERGPEWGALLAHRMMVTEGKSPKQSESANVRVALAELPPGVQEVSVSSHRLENLSQLEMWELMRKCHQFRSLDLSGWARISVHMLRSISLSAGASIHTVNLSRTKITDEMMEVFTSRLFSLRTINLASCNQLSNLGVRALATSCRATLTSVDLSDCPRLNSEAVAYIGGTIGFGSSCDLLQSLSLAQCKGMSDHALRALAQGCKNLRFLSLSGCDQVTTKGVKVLARGCPRLAVLNLYQCMKVQEGSLMAISRHCPSLVSLNVANIGRVTDRSLAELGRGCTSLQALNIASAKEVSEQGLCALAQSCPGLQILNLTGCMEVSLGGLQALICGIGEHLVEEAKTFFGFLPRQDVVHQRIEDSQRGIENRAARAIQECWAAHWKRKANRIRRLAALQHAAAFTLQMSFFHFHKKRAWWAARRLRKENKAAIEIQRVYRAHRVRKNVRTIRMEKQALLAKGSRAVPIQAIFRGFIARRDNRFVETAIGRLLEDREEELQNAAAVCIGALVRASLAHKMCHAWGELQRQRKRDMQIASKRIQCAIRAFLARIWLKKLRMEAEVRTEIRRRAAVTIQAFWRGAQGKHNGRMVKKEIERIKRARHRTAIKIQAVYRGHCGRATWKILHRQWKQESRAARTIQKVFRGSRVMSWPDMRMNKVALHIFMRQELEFQKRVDSAKSRYQNLVDDANRDSCSEDEDDDDIDNKWEEIWDEDAQQSTWYNSALKEFSDTRPFTFEKGLVGLKVQIYWPVEGRAFVGGIVRFHRKKGKHRVEYDNGDREWLNLEEEQDRVMLWVNQAWVLYKNYLDPAVAKGRAHKAMLSRKRRAHQHLFDRESRHHLHDEKNSKVRWYDPKTGEMHYAMEGAELWTMDQDEVGDIIFVHRDTQEVVYDDPRFEEGHAKERSNAKAKCLEDMRFAQYFCSELVEKYQKYLSSELSAKSERLLLDNLSSGESALKLGA